MKIILISCLLVLLIFRSNAQQELTDSVALQEIIVKAYENNRKLIDVPAAISLVNKTDLYRFNNLSILPVLNLNPGVRMEERSPGSYRLSIRGSTLRSPFGVRNVKVYFDGIPYTDPGGNSYLNQLGFYNIQSVEIIKGPGSSLYGAGTGGVLLIRNDVNQFFPGGTVDYSIGSFKLNNINANIRFGKEGGNNVINYLHQNSDGYRAHSSMHRDVLTWDALLRSTATLQMQAHFLYADLYYQTPGALTKSEYDLNAKAARPHAGANPSADEAKAAIYQKTFLAGFSIEQKFNDDWKNTTSIYGAYSQMRNPSFRNYGRTTEPHLGGRTVFQFNKKFNTTILTLHAGAEFQQSFNTQRIYNNRNGEPDSLQTDDEIYNSQGFAFIQAIAEIKKGWLFTAGASINRLTLNFRRLSTLPSINKERNFNNEITPRFAVLKKLNKTISIYTSIARGFSAPTTAEVLPSANIFNDQLQAESGIDYELGLRGSAIKNKFYFDINAFFYRLKNAIVQRRDAAGADYFDNAGSAKQNGLETFLSYKITDNELFFFKHIEIHVSNTWNNFHYKEFKQVNNDYSGNRLPGVAPETVAASFDVSTKIGIYANTTFFYSDRIALNDANTEYGRAYNLLGIRLGVKRKLLKTIKLEIFTGAENIFNEKYSLGNDINAAGGRYYNVAPGRNYYAGLSINFNDK
ncbi:MAG: TonB-dependent receptor plug domain-containing protein [Ginsengibacter sp.]